MVCILSQTINCANSCVCFAQTNCFGADFTFHGVYSCYYKPISTSLNVVSLDLIRTSSDQEMYYVSTNCDSGLLDSKN